MAYDEKEESTNTGEPYELYKFTGPLETFRYTSRPVEVTFNGETYTPLQIERGPIIVTANLGQQRTVDIMVPVDSDLTRAYTKANLPDSLKVEIWRTHVGDDPDSENNREWLGEASAYDLGKGVFTIKTRSVLQAKIRGNNTSVFYQFSCNNRVYDDRCQAVKASFTTSAEVTAISDTVITVDDDDRADNELKLGSIKNTRTGEERSIKDNVSNEITITYPFIDIVVGDTVELSLGCDNTMATCISRFNNLEHYTGFRYVPKENPQDQPSVTEKQDDSDFNLWEALKAYLNS